MLAEPVLAVTDDPETRLAFKRALSGVGLALDIADSDVEENRCRARAYLPANEAL